MNNEIVNNQVNEQENNGGLTEREIFLMEREKLLNKRRLRSKIFKYTILGIILFFACSFIYKNYLRPVKVDERIDKGSAHYATSLYYSDGKYYDKYLSSTEKKIYDIMFKDSKKIKATSVIECNKMGLDTSSCASSIDHAFDVLLMEHPDFFWLRHYSYETYNSYEIEIRYRYVIRNRLVLFLTERRMLRKMDEIVKSLDGKSEYDKVLGVYKWLGETTTYSTIITNKSGTAWSALLDDDAVCAGFAAASQLLFQRMGIDSVVVFGNTSGPHAWNFVKVDGKWYWYDSTVAGSVHDSDNDYFYKGLLFEDTSGYSVDFINLKDYNL